MTTIFPIEGLCRLCLDDNDENPSSVFQNVNFSTNPTAAVMSIAEIVQDITTIEIGADDGLPTHICKKCYAALAFIFEFRERSLRAQLKLLGQRVAFDVGDCQLKEKEEVSVRNEQVELEWMCKQPATTQIPLPSAAAKANLEHISLALKPPKKKKKKLEIKAGKLSGKRSKRVSKTKQKSIATCSAKLPCDICGKMYTPTNLKYHLNMHNGSQPFPCKVEGCRKLFANPNQLRVHHKVMHTNHYPFTCEVCGSKFKVRTTYIIHKSYHGDPQIPCTICGKLLRNKRSVKKHMMGHTGERPHPCTFCSKSFQNQYNLKVHMRVHTKEKPFVCSKCGESYGYNSLLKTHMEKYHAGETC